MLPALTATMFLTIPTIDSAPCSALFGSLVCPWLEPLGLLELQELNGRSTVEYECDPNAGRRCSRRNQDLFPFEGLVKIVHGKGDVGNGLDDVRYAAVRLKAHPLDPVRARLKTTDVNSQLVEVLLLSTRHRVGDPEVMVLPPEPR